jgi:hypothetical protein
MVRGRLYPRFRCAGRFYGRRVNCERVPMLPAWVVGRMFDDPRKIPYLLVWKSDDGTVAEAVRLSVQIDPPVPFSPDWHDVFEIKPPDRGRNFLRTILRPLPRNGAKVRLVVCPYCDTPRRALYGWAPGGQYTSSVHRSDWRCRACAGLRYASEGGALVLRSRGRWFRLIETQFHAPSARPESWLPYVFTSPEAAAAVLEGTIGKK